jgi:hypothetical protein
MPVVATTSWGGTASSASVAWRRGRSSPKGSVRTTGPVTTAAPHAW